MDWANGLERGARTGRRELRHYVRFSIATPAVSETFLVIQHPFIYHVSSPSSSDRAQRYQRHTDTGTTT